MFFYWGQPSGLKRTLTVLLQPIVRNVFFHDSRLPRDSNSQEDGQPGTQPQYILLECLLYRP
jgi:hypothetical protein